MDLLHKYFPELSPAQHFQFRSLDKLYREWNARINVISRKDIDHLYERHVLHSLAIAKIIEFAKGTKVIDVGTGGGFPGIPLAIYFPYVHFHLVDSIGKKIKVIDEIVSELNLKNVTTEQQRIGENKKNPNSEKTNYDFAVSRAVSSLKEMVAWLKPVLKSGNKSTLDNGMIFFKGGELNKEIKELNRPIQIFSISDFFEEEYFKEKKVVYLKV